MKPITLTATIDENHRLIIDVPEDVPVGDVEVTIRPKETTKVETKPATITFEEARAKLLAAGVLSQANFAPPDAVELSEMDEEILANQAAGIRTMAEYIDEDREERF